MTPKIIDQERKPFNEQLGCNKCKNFNLYPKIYWCKKICSILEYNKNQTKCINFDQEEIYKQRKFSFELQTTKDGSFKVLKLLQELLENPPCNFSYENLMVELIE